MSQNAIKPPLPYFQLLAVAVEAKADPRTVRKFLVGGHLQPRVRERIEGALKALDLAVAPRSATR